MGVSELAGLICGKRNVYEVVADTDEGKATDGTLSSSHGKVAHGKRELWS